MQKFYAIDDDLFEERESLECFKRTILAVYKSDETDQELSRLRERVGELELSLATERVVSLAAVEAKSEAEDRAADLESDLRHYGESEGARCASKIRKLETRERLLLEALRWALKRGVMAGQVWDCKSESFVDGIRECGGAFGEPIEPPPEFTPLIAEAVKPTPIRVSDPPCRNERGGNRCTLERHHDGDHEHE